MRPATTPSARSTFPSVKVQDVLGVIRVVPGALRVSAVALALLLRALPRTRVRALALRVGLAHHDGHLGGWLFWWRRGWIMVITSMDVSHLRIDGGGLVDGVVDTLRIVVVEGPPRTFNPRVKAHVHVIACPQAWRC